jgi:beta-glucosidase-like glycosyl hydrolase
VLFVRGMQELPTPHAWALKSSACCKHFAAYSIENWHGNSRHAFNAQVSERDLEETYLPAFRACVTRGKASCVMCSYNKINGIPACMSPLLKRLRGEWGFDGYITSDCQALGDAASSVGNASKAKDAILDAGVDLDCGAFFETHLTEADPVSAPAERLLRTQLRLGLFDRIRSEFQAVDGYRIATHASTRKHLDLALDAALQSFVLLKNRDAALPLPSASTFKRVALIGPLLDASASEMLGPCVGRW